MQFERRYWEVPCDKGMQVLQYAPTKRIVSFWKLRLQLPVPYQLYCLNRNQYGVAGLRTVFAAKKITRPSDLVYFPPLPNIYNNGEVCFHDEPITLTEFISSFWSERFVTGKEIVWLGVESSKRIFGERKDSSRWKVWAEKSIEEILALTEQLPSMQFDEWLHLNSSWSNKWNMPWRSNKRFG